MPEMKLYPIYKLDSSTMIDYGSRLGTFEDITKSFSSSGGYFVADPDDLPADFSVDTYTIVDGELVRLPAEVIAEREAAALRASEQAATVAEIARLKEHLTATDWAVVKCLEIGAPLAEIYPELHAQRTAARASINTLEEQTKTTAQ